MRILRSLCLALLLAACGTPPPTEGPDAGESDPADADAVGGADAGAGARDASAVRPDAASEGPDAAPVRPDAASAGPDAALPPAPGKKVLLYTGAGGGGPTSDLFLDDVAATLTSAGIASTTSSSLPAGFASDYGVLWLMNPMQAVPADVSAAAAALLERGGRVVLITDHCKNGCWLDADDDNALLSSLGSAIRVSGSGGAPLSQTSLAVTAVPKITDGVSSVVVFYSGSVSGGTLFGRVPGGDAVMAYEKVELGDVVAIADVSAFGYVLGKGDNQRLVKNLGVPLR